MSSTSLGNKARPITRPISHLLPYELNQHIFNAGQSGA